jgi:DNA polymerase I-like protein with 3'-5' exonuclease and polymerase domains
LSFGRKLPVREINSKNAAMRQAAERAAINAPLQGSAADIIKRAMIAVGNLDVPLLVEVGVGPNWDQAH